SFAAGHGCVETSGGAVSWNLRARGILRDFEPFAIDAIAGDVAVTEVRRGHESVVRRAAEPAQLRRQACACVDFHQWAYVNLAIYIDGCQGASVANGISDDEGIRPAF